MLTKILQARYFTDYFQWA